MRTYPHKPDQENVEFNLRTALEQIRTLTEKFEAAGGKSSNPSFFQILAGAQTATACGLYATEQPIAKVEEYVREASKNLARAIELKVEIDPVEFVDIQAAAVVAGDDNFAALLAQLPRKRYTSEDVDATEIHFLVAEMFSDLILGRDKELTARLAMLKKKLIGKKVSKEEHLWADTLVSIAAAIGAGQQEALDTALIAREKDYAKTYRSPDEREEPDSLLDLAGLALLRLALRRGLKYSGTSVYLAAELLAA